MGVRSVNHLSDQFRIVEHQAGAHVVFIEGLAFLVFHKQQGAECINQVHIFDIDVGTMDEGSGLNIAVGIDI